jgi:hypothetical protein
MDYAVYHLDFTGEGRRRVNLFSYLLGYSRRQYLRFVESQDMTTTLREHLRAFEHLGGVAATCLYDNMKVVVTGCEDDVPVYNSRFLAFATHYGFRPVACRPRWGQTKGKVERPFYYVETSFFNDRTFSSLDHLNEMTVWWLAHVANVRQLREAKKTPLQLYAEERPHLISLPAQAYDVYLVVYRTVNIEVLVTYCQNGYSVPWRYIGSMLPVRITEKELIVYGREVEEIARHVLLPRTVTGQRVVHKEHRPVEDARRRQAQLEERFAELGEPGCPEVDLPRGLPPLLGHWYVPASRWTWRRIFEIGVGGPHVAFSGCGVDRTSRFRPSLVDCASRFRQFKAPDSNHKRFNINDLRHH